ncbi:hypothetical protein MKX03_032326 [Papaver bracteatum]|nr:hypothetical protein MKX03_032326 [Papaver bracteatum]
MKITTATSLVFAILLFVSSIAFASLTQGKQLQVVVEEEVDALLKWKSTLVNHTHSLLHSWKINTTGRTRSPCKWYGIVCNSKGSIAELNITGLGIQGTLHSFNFSSFSNIVSVYLSQNNLFGHIPSQICNLSKLMHLDLSVNTLSGYIPPEMGYLTSLHLLDLSQNQINGSIPQEIGHLRHLTDLWLYMNNRYRFLEINFLVVKV